MRVQGVVSCGTGDTCCEAGFRPHAFWEALAYYSKLRVITGERRSSESRETAEHPINDLGCCRISMKS